MKCLLVIAAVYCIQVSAHHLHQQNGGQQENSDDKKFTLNPIHLVSDGLHLGVEIAQGVVDIVQNAADEILNPHQSATTAPPSEEEPSVSEPPAGDEPSGTSAPPSEEEPSVSEPPAEEEPSDTSAPPSAEEPSSDQQQEEEEEDSAVADQEQGVEPFQNY